MNLNELETRARLEGLDRDDLEFYARRVQRQMNLITDLAGHSAGHSSKSYSELIELCFEKREAIVQNIKQRHKRLGLERPMFVDQLARFVRVFF